jgi:hypothetical protein
MRRHRKRQPGRRKLRRFETSWLILYRLIHLPIIVMGAVTRELFGRAAPATLHECSTDFR